MWKIDSKESNNRRASYLAQLGNKNTKYFQIARPFEKT